MTKKSGARAEKFLQVDHLESDLLGRTVRGGMATLALQGLKAVAQIAAIVILARLLAPEDFGRFALVAAFLAALELFKDLGLSTAVVQRSRVEPRQLDTLFWMNAGLGLIAAVLMAAVAPLLAYIFREPVLLEITPVAGLAFLFTGLAAQHSALLRRQMRFSTLAVSQGGAEIVAILSAIAAALAGAGIWALVVQRLVWAAANAAVAWLACSWRPGRPGPIREVRDFVAFGGNATASMMVGYLVGYLDNILIGWYSGTGALGLYERSQRVLLLPIRNLNIPLGSVVIAALSRLDSDPTRYRRFYVGAVERLAMIIAPLGGFLFGVAGPAVALILGPQWTDAVPILMWMAPSALYLPATYALSWLYMSQDRTPEMLRAGAAGAALTFVAIVGGVTFGPVGVAAGITVSGFVARTPLLFWLVGRTGPVRTRDLYAVLAAPAAAFVAVAAATTAARRFLAVDTLSLPVEVAVLFAVSIVSAAVVYVAVPRTRRAIRGLARLPRMLGRMAPKAA